MENHEAAARVKRDVLDEMRAILARPEDLARVPALLEERLATQAANAKAVVELTAMQTSSLATGLSELHAASVEVGRIRKCFAEIQELCRESDVLSDEQHHQSLALAHAQANIFRTQMGVEEIYCIPQQADEAQAMIDEADSDPSALMDAFEVLTKLTYTSAIAAETMGKDRAKIGAVENVQRHFDRVHAVMSNFEEKLFGTFDDVVLAAKETPQHLVMAVRIVLAQEQTRERLKDKAPEMSYRALAVQRIERSVEAVFEPLLTRASTVYDNWFRSEGKDGATASTVDDGRGASLGHGDDADGGSSAAGAPAGRSGLRAFGSVIHHNGAAGSSDDITCTEMHEVLEQADEVIADLADFYDFVAPCFPDTMSPLVIAVGVYNSSLSRMLDYLGHCSPAYDVQSLLHLIRWAGQYKDKLFGLGVSDEVAVLSTAPLISTPLGTPVEASGLDVAQAVYVQSVRTMLQNCFRNLVAIDVSKEPDVQENGRLWYPGVIEMFRLLTDQVGVAATVHSNEIVVSVAQVALEVMHSHQDLVRKNLQELDLTFEKLVSNVNTNLIAHDQALELAQVIREALQDSRPEDRSGGASTFDSDHSHNEAEHTELTLELNGVDMDTTCRGFLNLATLALTKTVDCIFADPGTVALFKQFCCTPEWTDGTSMLTWLETLKDYFRDLRTWLDGPFFKRAVQYSLNGTVKCLAEALVKQLPKGGLTQEATERVESDVREVSRFFTGFIALPKVVEGLEPLEQFKRVLLCESPDDFTECFQFMLASQQAECLLKPADVGVLCAKRPDISRADAAAIQKECEKIHQDWVSGKVVRQFGAPEDEPDEPVGFITAFVKSPFRRMLGRAET